MNHVRGLLRQFGVRVESCSTPAFAERATKVIPAELKPALVPVIEALRTLTQQIAVHDQQVTELVNASPAAQRIAQIDGVGPITALAFRLTIDQPSKFKKSRVGARVPGGSVPAKDQSGASDPQKHITKAGNPFLRRLLVQCAHRLLGVFGPDCDLRRWGLTLCARGGPAGKKRAIVAVARKLAVVMHRVWVTGRPYDSNFHALTA